MSSILERQRKLADRRLQSNAKDPQSSVSLLQELRNTLQDITGKKGEAAAEADDAGAESFDEESVLFPLL